MYLLYIYIYIYEHFCPCCTVGVIVQKAVCIIRRGSGYFELSLLLLKLQVPCSFFQGSVLDMCIFFYLRINRYVHVFGVGVFDRRHVFLLFC